MAKARQKKQEEPEVTEETMEKTAAKDETAAPAAEEKKPETAGKTAGGANKAKDDASAAMQMVEVWGEELNLAYWEVAGVKRALGWAHGKMVTEDLFKRALAAFRARGMGGGRIRLE